MTDTSLITSGAYGTASGELGIIHIKVADADRAMAFYGALLNWESERFEDDYVAHYVVNTKVLHVLTADPEATDVRLALPW